MTPRTLIEPHTADDRLHLTREAYGWFTLKTDDGQIELTAEEFAEVIQAGNRLAGRRVAA